MPSLFVLPRQVPLSSAAALMAGAKLTFSATGTSTLQNTYSDIALTTPNANPVVADGNGVFGKIYLDPSLPNYRVKLTTSADVLIYQEDDVPSNQNTSQQFRLKAVAPSLTFEETDASSNNKIWRLKVNGEQLLLTILDDAEATETTVFTFDRTGTTPDALNFAGQYLKVNGAVVATQDGGSFTATLTGFTGTVTGTVKWWRSGTKVSFFVPAAITGTSNAATMGMNGMPSGLLMSSNAVWALCRVTDNGTTQLGMAIVQKVLDAPPGIVFALGVAGSGGFTSSGTKGLPAGAYFVYDSDGVSIA